VRKLPWGIIFFIIWGLFLTTSVTLYLNFLQPAKLGYTASSVIESRLGLSSDIGFIKLQFFPHPAIIAKHLVLNHDKHDLKIKIDELHAILSWKTLLVGRPIIESISVFNPTVEFVLLAPPQEKKDTLPTIKTSTLPIINAHALQTIKTRTLQTINTAHVAIQNTQVQDFATPSGTQEEQLKSKTDEILKEVFLLKIPSFFTETSLYLRNGLVSVTFPQSDGTLTINNINIDLRLPDILSGHLDLRLGKTILTGKNTPEIQLNKTSLLITGWRLNTGSIKASLHMQSQFQMGSLEKPGGTPIRKAYQYFPMPKPARFSIRKEFDYDKKAKTLDASGSVQVKVILPMNGYNTPVELDIPFSFKGVGENDGKSLREIPKRTEGNASFIDAFLKDNNNLPDKAVQLPFLYIDTIKIKNAHIKMDSDTAIATGELLGLYPLSPFFQGKAKVNNFSLARWIGASRKMSGGLVNALNNISGQLTFMVNKRGVYASHLEGSVCGITMEGIGSCGDFLKPDVAIKIKPTSETLKKGAINVNPLFPEINGVSFKKVELPPAAVPERNKDDTSPSIYVDYHIDITVPHADIWKVSAKSVHVLISPNLKETPTIRVSIDDLYKGTAKAYVILEDGDNYIEASLRNVDLEEPVRRIVGFTAARGLLDTEAKIHLSGNSIEAILSSLQVDARGEIKKGSFHSEQSILHDFTSTAYRVNIKAVPFDIPKVKLPTYFQMKGYYELITQDNNLESRFSSNAIIDFSTSSGLPLRMNLQDSEMQYYTRGETKLADFFVKGKGLLGYDTTKNEYLTIRDFNGTFNGDIVTGSYSIHRKNQLAWSGKIHFDALNLDKYLFNEEANEPTKELETDSFLPIHFLSTNSMNYELSAREAILFGTTLENLSSHIKLNNGNLIIEKTTGKIKGGGDIQAFLEATVTENLPKKRGNIQTQFKFQANNANMLAITTMRQHDTLMAGNALLQLDGNGTFQTSADILRKLNGTWNINIQNGYIQNVKLKTSVARKENLASHTPIVPSSQAKIKRGSKTHFNSLLASGTIKNGIVSNPSFLISSPTLSITGSGTLDLPSKEIKANAIATYRGVSKIPITITGNIDNPVSNVKVLGAVTGTLGEISSGLFETLGNILSTPIYLFKQEKPLAEPSTQ